MIRQKLLLAIKSCIYDLNRGCHQVIRDTWGRDIKDADLKFFYGCDTLDKPRMNDEVALFVDDNYNALPYKTQLILKYALAIGYQYIFLADCDTFIKFDKLINCGFEKYDYAGKIDKTLGEKFHYMAVDREGHRTQIETFGWASGGYGYFLSKKAAKYVTAAKIDTWAEDLFVGNVLGPLIKTSEIKALHISGGTISEHFPATRYHSGYDPKFKWQEEMYEAVK